MENNINNNTENNNIENNDNFVITGFTVGYIGTYKGHYCLVRISPLEVIIMDDKDERVFYTTIKEGKIDVNDMLEKAPNIIKNHIESKYYEKQ